MRLVEIQGVSSEGCVNGAQLITAAGACSSTGLVVLPVV